MLVRKREDDTALHEKIAVLEEQVAFFKRELGLDSHEADAQKLNRVWGLTGSECAFLLHLYNKRGRVATKQSLMTALYDDREEAPEIKIIDVFACKVRRKLPLYVIETVWGTGYALTTLGMNLVKAALDAEAPQRERFDRPPSQILKSTTMALQALRHIGNGVSEVHGVSEAMGQPYARVHNYVMRLVSEGYVECVDWRMGPKGHRRAIYAPTTKGKNRLAHLDAPAE